MMIPTNEKRNNPVTSPTSSFPLLLNKLQKGKIKIAATKIIIEMVFEMESTLIKPCIHSFHNFTLLTRQNKENIKPNNPNGMISPRCF